jgi:hypothetical protein
MSLTHATTKAITGEPEVVEDVRALAADVEHSPAWLRLKDAATALQGLQAQDGSVPSAGAGSEDDAHAEARDLVETIVESIRELAPRFPHDAEYLAASAHDFERWADGGFAVPDFLESLMAFQPQQHRVDGLRHLVVFPMYTQNGSSDRHVEALIVEVIWPEFIAQLEAGDYGNKLFVSLRFVDFTPGYDTNSAVLFPETVAMREIPSFTWGAIFQDREAARYRRVVRAASEITKLELPADAASLLDDQKLAEETYTNKLFLSLRLVDFTPGYDTNSAVLFPETVAMREIPPFTWGAIFQDREAARFRRVVDAAADVTRLELLPSQQRLLEDQHLAEEVFVMWDLIHDRSHMRGDLPFDPFMIKQRMPFFLYSLEELRCDLTAFRECVALARDENTDEQTRDRAVHVQHAILFDRIFRFPLTGSRVRNYDGLGGQLLFAWLHQRDVLHWTDTQLAFDWDAVPDAVIALSDAIDELYWRSIDRPKTAHWLAAYELVRGTLAPNPASVWARGLPDEVLAGPPKGYTDAVLDDEFPLSMFYEALAKKMTDVIDSTRGITGRSHPASATETGERGPSTDSARRNG